jgi:hypothetical protein
MQIAADPCMSQHLSLNSALNRKTYRTPGEIGRWVGTPSKNTYLCKSILKWFFIRVKVKIGGDYIFCMNHGLQSNLF